jgi:hypothetical protein
LNPLKSEGLGTFSNGNLDFVQTTAGNETLISTISLSNGLWYWEVTLNSSTNNTPGIAPISEVSYPGAGSGFGWGCSVGDQYINGSTASAPTATTGDVIGFAFNSSTYQLKVYKNGVEVTFSPVTVTSGLEYFAAFGTTTGNSAASTFNFGQRPFVYPAPAGFVSLNTANIEPPSILNGSEYMDVALYEGNGGTLTVSGLEFAPDWTWIKSRDFTDYNMIFDRVRGAGAWLINDNVLSTPEGSVNQYGVLSSFTSDGFVVTGGSINANRTNRTGINYVSWNWYSGGGSPVSNTDGTRPSSVLVSATTGMSIVSYSGSGTQNATVGHELSTPPEVIIVRNRTTAANTIVYTTVLDGSLDYFLMNASQAAANAAPNPPNSSVFSIWDNADTGANGDNYIAYCFTQVEGYSSFGTGYTNGSPTDNGYVYTGFRPRVVWLKQSSTTSNWLVIDTARSPYNVADDRLQLNDDNAEDTTYDFMDILSNGFKLRSSAYGDAGATFFYMAWAENPFSIARAR